jgi:hypothetical protein
MMKSADRLPITVARSVAHDSARVVPNPGSTGIAITSHVTLAIEDFLRDAVRSSGRHDRRFPIGLAAAEHRPGNARHLVGQRHGDEAGRLARQQPG